MFIGDNRRAVEMADRALEVAEHADLVALLADTLITKGSALGDLGRIQEGIGAIETGERLARSAGLAATVLRGINNRMVHQGEIDPAAVLEASTEGLALSRRMGQRLQTFGFSVATGSPLPPGRVGPRRGGPRRGPGRRPGDRRPSPAALQ